MRKYKIFIFCSIIFWYAMFFIDNSGAFLDGTEYYIYGCAVLSVVFATLGLNVKSIPGWKNILIWTVFLFVVIFSVKPAVNNHKFKQIDNPGVELSNPPGLTIIYGENEIKTTQCGYNWYYDDRLKKETKGFSGWIRIGDTAYSTARFNSKITEAELNFIHIPDKFEIRYWKEIDWDFPSDLGKKIRVGSDGKFEVRQGYYRVTANWDDYGYVVYGFIIK